MEKESHVSQVADQELSSYYENSLASIDVSNIICSI